MPLGDAYALGITKHLFGRKGEELRDRERFERRGNRSPLHRVGNYKREVAADGGVTGEFAGGGLAQVLFVEAV